METGSDETVVAIGSDHAGYDLKEELKEELGILGFRALDMGTGSVEPCDYPEFAMAVAGALSRGEAARGVLVCGTGAGMAIAANKVPGVRAAVCNETFTAEQCRLHNDANVIAFGSRIVDAAAAREILGIFMSTGFEGGRHARRVDGITKIERRYTEGC